MAERQIRLVGILGSTMGVSIAAHLANMDIPVILLDAVPQTAERSDDPAARNRLAQAAFDAMASATPGQLASPDRGELIYIGNLSDDFDKLADCDWIIDAMIFPVGLQRLPDAVKQVAQMTLLVGARFSPDIAATDSFPNAEWMDKLDAVRKPHSIISSTTGTAIATILDGRSEAFKRDFVATHFSLPARFVELVEVVSSEHTDPEMKAFLIDFLETVLGKEVVECKDTPDFIANRYLGITLSHTIEYALDHGYRFEEVDAYTGSFIGRSDLAPTFHVIDMAGEELVAFLATSLYPSIPDDPYRDNLRGEQAMRLFSRLLGDTWRGRLAPRMFHHAQRRLNGFVGRALTDKFYKEMVNEGRYEEWVLNPTTLAYEPQQKVTHPAYVETVDIEDLGERLRKVLTYDDPCARFVREEIYFCLAYSAYLMPIAAYSLDDFDEAIRMGFSHDAGPFEIWDMLGVAETVEKMEAIGFTVAPWVKAMLAAGHSSFYRDGTHYHPETGDYQADRFKPAMNPVEQLRAEGKQLAQNDFAHLLDMGDGVALLAFNRLTNSMFFSNTIDGGTVEMIHTALDRLETDFDALVIGNYGRNFSSGAHLLTVMRCVEENRLDDLYHIIRSIAGAGQRLLSSSKPIVSAPHSVSVGAGTALAMSSWASVALMDTFMGYAECALGVVAAAGGVANVLRVKLNPAVEAGVTDILPIAREAFSQLADSKISGSALEAQRLGYLRLTDEVSNEKAPLLAKAKAKALELVQSEAATGPQAERIFVPGPDVLAILKMDIQRRVWSGEINAYEGRIMEHSAWVFCGGDIAQATWVKPEYVYDLETAAFIETLAEPKTLERLNFYLTDHGFLKN